MVRSLLVGCVVLTAVFVWPFLSDGADAEPSKFEVPFGILVRTGTCAAATHVVLDPCPPHAPGMYVAFPQGKNVTRYEGQNVTLRGTLDQTICTLPLLEANRVALTDVLPPCPPPEP